MNIVIKELFFITACMLLLLSVNCFAEWRDWPDVCEDIFKSSSSETIDFIKANNASREFGKNTRTTPGTHLTSVDKDWRDSVDLRINYNKIDYRVHIFKILSDETCDLYLELLDSDKYLIKSVYISKLDGKYTGTIAGSFDLLHDCSVKKSNIIILK